MRAEVSYDLAMTDDMAFVEGTFRLPGTQWQVVIASKRDVSEPVIQKQQWDSGVTGVVIQFPKSVQLNRNAVEQVLADEFGVSEWEEVRGPDSTQLR
jgi:hypothetical protein